MAPLAWIERSVDAAGGAVRSVRAHALRYTLTSLGVAWGIFTLAYLQAAVDGFHAYYEQQITKVGERLIVFFPGSEASTAVGERGARFVPIERRDLESTRRVATVAAATPEVGAGFRVVRAAGRTKLMYVLGVSHEAEQVRSFTVEHGRFLAGEDASRSARVAFLGARAKERLFGRAPAVGSTIRIDGLPFRVVGVSRPKGSQLLSFGRNDDDQILIPYTAAQRALVERDTIDSIFAQATPGAEPSGVATEVRARIARNHGLRTGAAIDVFDLEEGLAIVRLLGLGMGAFFLATSVITLAVGAIGVMNIMWLVVGERTREIGLKKAVGAPSSAVFVELLLEAMLVTSMAGLAGIALGWGAVAATTALVPVDPLTRAPVTAVPILSLGTVAVISVGIVGVGILAGMLPAISAMRIDPAEALREG